MSSLQALLRPPFRLYFCALVALAVFELCFGALYLQGVVHVYPCPLCIMQRYALTGIGLVALVAAVHGRAGRIYGALVVVVALLGVGVAVRQTWLQLYPSEALACGPGLSRFVNDLPFAQWWPEFYESLGDCGAVEWTLLGLSIANWGLITFVGVTVVTLWLILRRA
ncbi:MAG: disulfide bond formation protein B [Azoarcus sp.]|jgi:disulfide bond formation protein DsbB|nr:disulfide bond formation protein B [Azoarcus sp.]